jgi:hypothetical protein
MNKPLVSTSALMALALALGGGCTVKSSSTTTSSNPDAIDEGSDANEAEEGAGNVGSSLIGGDSTGLAPASQEELSMSASEAAAGGGSIHSLAIGDAAKRFYQPAGCLVVTSDLVARSAKYDFSDCTGPYGLVHVTGEIDVTWSSSGPAQLTLNFTASNFKVNQATIDSWQASADITATGSDRDMKWNGHFTGTTKRGRAFERTNTKEYKWTVGGTCLSVDGTSDGTVTGHELKTDVINFKKCLGACPEAGSEIKITDVTANKVYDVTWNAADATYTGPNGGTITFKPLCAQ